MTFFACVVNYTCICVHACAGFKSVHTCVFNVFKTVCIHVFTLGFFYQIMPLYLSPLNFLIIKYLKRKNRSNFKRHINLIFNIFGASALYLYGNALLSVMYVYLHSYSCIHSYKCMQIYLKFFLWCIIVGELMVNIQTRNIEEKAFVSQFGILSTIYIFSNEFLINVFLLLCIYKHNLKYMFIVT